MKKFLLMLFLSAAFTTQAIEQVTVSYGYSWNGYTTLPVDVVGNIVTLRVEIHHWDYVIDEFSLEFCMPDGLELMSINRGRDLDMVVFDEQGEPYTYSAPIEVNGNMVSCKINEIGYEDLDEDGLFEPYGTVKFQEGNQEILFIEVKVLDGFERGTIIIDGYFGSQFDLRQYTQVCKWFEFVSYAVVNVEYDRGDVNGDGGVTIADVTALIDKLMEE